MLPLRTLAATTAIALAFSSSILAESHTAKPLSLGSTAPVTQTNTQNENKPSKQSMFACAITDRGTEKTKGWAVLLKHAQDWTKVEPQEAMAWFVLGLAYDSADHTAEAIKAYKHALRIKPKDVRILFRLGIAYIRSKQTEEALKVLKQVLSIKPEDPQAWFALGVAYAASGHDSKAIEAVRQANNIHPQADMWGFLSVAYVRPDQTARVVKVLREALFITVEVKVARGLFPLRVELANDAIKAIQRVLHVKSEDSEVWYILGLAYTTPGTLGLTSGRLDENTKVYSRLKQLDPALACQFFNNVLLP